MPIDQQALSKKVSFSSSDIKTMKKDLKRLREADVVKESQKIIGLEAPAQEMIPPPTPAVTMALKEEPIAKVLPPKEIAKPIPKVIPAPVKVAAPTPPTRPATAEEQKQQAFLLEGQKTELQEVLFSITKEQMPQVALEKNTITKERQVWEKQLAELLIQITSAAEDKKEELEKKRWAIEKELATLENRLSIANESEADLKKQETDTTLQVSAIDAKLQKLRPVTPLKPQLTPEHPKAPVVASPPTLKETFVASVKTEEEKRRKFMEDIEAWASSNKN